MQANAFLFALEQSGQSRITRKTHGRKLRKLLLPLVVVTHVDGLLRSGCAASKSWLMVASMTSGAMPIEAATPASCSALSESAEAALPEAGGGLPPYLHAE